jgi:hypothetical protein
MESLESAHDVTGCEEPDGYSPFNVLVGLSVVVVLAVEE